MLKKKACFLIYWMWTRSFVQFGTLDMNYIPIRENRGHPRVLVE